MTNEETEAGPLPLTMEGIKKALARAAKPSPAQRRRFIDSLKAEIAVYEERYKMRTAEVREAINAALLHENLDVVKWGLAADTLARLEETPANDED